MVKLRTELAGAESSAGASVKRTEILLQATQARNDKLDLENQRLRAELMHEERQRREANEEQRQAVAQLRELRAQAAPERDEVRATVQSEAEQHEKEQRQMINALKEEIEAFRRKLVQTQNELSSVRDEAQTARDELAAEWSDLSEPIAIGPAAAGAADHNDGVGGGGDDEFDVGSPPSEAYRAMQLQRQQLTKYAHLLEDRLRAQEHSQGRNARQRRTKARTAMVDYCTHVSKQLQVAETRMSRGAGLLEPTLNQLNEAQGAADEMAAHSAQLEEEVGKSSFSPP